MAHPRRCFRCIESLASVGAPLAVWQRELGDSFQAVEPLLTVTDRLAARVPGARTDLPMMRVVDYRDGRFAAVCDEEMSPRLELTREQVVMRRADEARLRSMLCRALSLIATRDPVTTIPGLLRVGTWQSMPSDQRPVLLAVASHAAHLVELILQAMTSTRGTLVLLTPTRARWSSRSEEVADPDRVLLIALDEVLEWRNGQWSSGSAWKAHFRTRVTPVDSPPVAPTSADGPAPVVARLKEMERHILVALGERSVVGLEAKNLPGQQQLAKWAGYDWDTSFKTALSTLCKTGLLDNGRHHGRRGGYFLSTEGAAAAQLIDKS